MLKLANVTKADTVYDLGCGDGRIVITAAKQFGAHGVGVDINPERIQEANENARRAGVADKVKFIEGDLFTADIRPATVVMLYLLPSVNLKLRPRLLSDLKPGTRVVSHSFDMDDWKPDQAVMAEGAQLFLWVIADKESARATPSWLTAGRCGCSRRSAPERRQSPMVRTSPCWQFDAIPIRWFVLIPFE